MEKDDHGSMAAQPKSADDYKPGELARVRVWDIADREGCMKWQLARQGIPPALSNAAAALALLRDRRAIVQKSYFRACHKARARNSTSSAEMEVLQSQLREIDGQINEAKTDLKVERGRFALVYFGAMQPHLASAAIRTRELLAELEHLRRFFREARHMGLVTVDAEPATVYIPDFTGSAISISRVLGES